MKLRLVIAVLSAALVVTACSSDPKPDAAAPKPASPTPVATTVSPTPTPPPPPPQRSLLSGRLNRPNGRVIAVKIDNTAKAHPQVGLTKADVVYVEQVEGGATRLAAIYSSRYPKYVGPVRSARISDIDLLRQYGLVKLIYSGSQTKLVSKLVAAKLALVPFDNNPRGFTRVAGRPAPYDVIGDVAQLRNRSAMSSRPRLVGYRFGAPPAGGRKVHHVRVTYPFCTVEADWSRQQQRWLLSMDGSPDMAAEGGRLGPQTFIVQFTRITASPYHDVNGANTPETHTVGSGKALIFRNGRVYHALWRRPTAWQPTVYTINGKRAVLDPGQIWVALTSPGAPVSTG